MTIATRLQLAGGVICHETMMLKYVLSCDNMTSCDVVVVMVCVGMVRHGTRYRDSSSSSGSRSFLAVAWEVRINFYWKLEGRPPE